MRRIMFPKSANSWRSSPQQSPILPKRSLSTSSSSSSSITSTKPIAARPKSNYDITIVEVGPRDGLQNEPKSISVNDKVTLIQNLHQAGCSVIEAGSFVSPKWVPQMANSDQIFQNVSFPANKNKPYLSCLVPNLHGMEQALQCRPVMDEVAIFASASEAFSQHNIACSIEESFHRFRPVLELAAEHNLPVRGYVSTVVGCPYQGPVAPRQVAKVVQQLLEMGCYEISLGDTIGIGTPGSIRSMLEEVLLVAKPSQLAMHFHDTYGQALANILVGLERGISTIDSSVAGLGGCPYARPGNASGNVATEDVVYMLHGMGLSTGIDLPQLVQVGRFISKDVLGKSTIQSKVSNALAVGDDPVES